MTREQAIAELLDAQRNIDTEAAHCDADAVICELLQTLGYHDVVAEYHKVEKWFA